jgi:hypothetical protein
VISFDKIHSPLTVHRPRKWDSDLSVSHTSPPLWIFRILTSIKHFILAKHAPSIKHPINFFSYLCLGLLSHPTSPQLHLQNQILSLSSKPHRNSPLYVYSTFPLIATLPSIGSYWTSSHIWICNFLVVINWIYMFL